MLFVLNTPAQNYCKCLSQKNKIKDRFKLTSFNLNFVDSSVVS